MVPRIRYKALLPGTIINRTYGTYKNLSIYLFLRRMFGPIYYGPPQQFEATSGAKKVRDTEMPEPTRNFTAATQTKLMSHLPTPTYGQPTHTPIAEYTTYRNQDQIRSIFIVNILE